MQHILDIHCSLWSQYITNIVLLEIALVSFKVLLLLYFYWEKDNIVLLGFYITSFNKNVAISNLVDTTCFWNDHHQVAQSQKIQKPNNVEILWASKSKFQKGIVKIYLGHICLREVNLRYNYFDLLIFLNLYNTHTLLSIKTQMASCAILNI
jgi:hypothetical protein